MQWLNAIVLVLLVSMCFSLMASAQDIIVDNDNGAPGYVRTGSWNISSATGYAGGTYHYVFASSGDSTASATWTADIPTSRRYQIYAAFRNGTNRTPSAPLTVTHAEGTTLIRLDQYGSGTVEEKLVGEFQFEAGTTASVRMDNNGADGAYIADAMIWRPVVDPKPTISLVTHQPEFPMDTEEVLVTARVIDNVRVSSVELRYSVSPSGMSDTITALDDGAHGDGGSNDAVYGATIPAQPADSIVAYYFAAWDDLGQSQDSRVYYYRSGPLPLSIPDVIVDNDDGSPAYVETGTWSTGSSTGYAGSTYRYVSTTSGSANASATWTATIPQSGLYRVYAVYVAGPNRTAGAPLTITHAGGQTVIEIDQSVTSDLVQTYLGTYPFQAGAEAIFRLDNNGDPGVCIADAIVLTLPSDSPPEVYRVTRNPVAPARLDSVLFTACVSDDREVSSVTFTYRVSAADTSLPAYDDGLHDDGEADDGLYGVTLPPGTASTGAIVSYYFSATDSVGQTATSETRYYKVGEPAHSIYIVLSSDTSVWNGIRPGEDIVWRVFTSQTGTLSKVFDPSFRYSHSDSLGRPMKISWFMMGGAWFLMGNNTTASSATYYMNKYWGDDLETWGDELQYHFHHYVYTDDWEMAPTFEETISEYEWTMSSMMLDESLFATAFRSGWNYMDHGYQRYLERWVPFRMEGQQGSWTPYHPSPTNWRAEGTMKGWEVRHTYMQSFYPYHAFEKAQAGTDQVMCVWSHQNEDNFPEQIDRVHQEIQHFAPLYPTVQFYYCSANEAMQKWLGHENEPAPKLEVFSSVRGSSVSVTVETIEDIYQEQPWVAARDYADEYSRLDCSQTGPGIWQFSYSRDEYDKVCVGISDIYGNSAMKEVLDGSRRWSNQSDFSEGVLSGVDLDTTATSVRLEQVNDVYIPSGSVTLDHSIGSDRAWRSLILTGNTPAGTELKCRYKTADSQSDLDDADWSEYQSTMNVLVAPDHSLQPWIRFEILLEGSSALTPELESVEVHYSETSSEVWTSCWTVY